jgi:hypothetical protein
VGGIVPVLTQEAPERYKSAEGHTMQREQGETPNGNPIGGYWVLRSPSGSWIDYDQYRNDLAERHGCKLIAT